MGSWGMEHTTQAISPLLHRSPLAGGLVIPVEWAKRHLVVNQSIFGASKKYGSAAIAQLRKDMSRDIAYINGRIVNGDEVSQNRGFGASENCLK